MLCFRKRVKIACHSKTITFFVLIFIKSTKNGIGISSVSTKQPSLLITDSSTSYDKPLVCLNYFGLKRTDRKWSVHRERERAGTMNAGDENDKYVDFSRCYSYQH